MARSLPSTTLFVHMQKLGLLPAPVSFLIVLAAVFSMFSAVTFLCGSHNGVVKSLRGKEEKKLTVRLGDSKKPVIEKMKSSMSSKALLMAKMISWRKVQDEGDAAHEGSGYGDNVEEFNGEDDAVWKKTIIKGEKCRPIDFSGKILYDSDGNLLPD